MGTEQKLAGSTVSSFSQSQRGEGVILKGYVEHPGHNWYAEQRIPHVKDRPGRHQSDKSQEACSIEGRVGCDGPLPSVGNPSLTGAHCVVHK